MNSQKRDMVAARRRYYESVGEQPTCGRCGTALNNGFLSDFCDDCERDYIKPLLEAEREEFRKAGIDPDSLGGC